MLVRVALEGNIAADGGEALDSIAADFDTAMEELFTLGASDPAIDLSLGDSDVLISVVVEVKNFDDAVSAAGSKIRTALHAANISTPEWPTSSSSAWNVRFVSSRSSRVEHAAA